jgi:hypothetical protein
LFDLQSLLRRAPWLRTKRPAHAFVLGRSRLTYVGPEKPGRIVAGTPPAVRAISRPLPADAFTEGASGAPVAGASLAGAVARLLAEAAVKMPAASLVVPDDFVRVLVVEVEEPERHAKEVEEILTWKFGRTFGEPVPPLRLSWRPAGPGGSGTRVLALAVPEEAVLSWEAPFEKAGVRIGAVEIESLAVSSLGATAIAGEGFVVWARGPTATVAHFEKGDLRFLRVRSATDALAALQELRLTASYVSPAAPSSDAPADDRESPIVRIPCAAGPSGAPVVDAFVAFRAEHGGPPVASLSLAALLPGTRVASGRAEGAELLVALGAMAGGD